MSDILSILGADAAFKASARQAIIDRRLAAEKAAADAAHAAYLALSPKEKHDLEVAGQRRWIACRQCASYFWLVVKDGVVTQEWEDLCDCDDKAEHDADGHTKRGWPAVPFTLAVTPISTSQILPSAIDLVADGHVYEIGIGDEPIWGHRNRFAAETGIEEEAVMFGVRHADGSEEVSTIDHNGKVVKHDSYAAASAHMEPTSAFFNLPKV